MNLVIAIDGPSAAGKGTLARRLAEALNLAYLDTGAIYRAVGSKVAALGREAGDGDYIAVAEGLTPSDMDRADLRTERVARLASVAASLPEVRAALKAYQQRFAAEPPDGKAGAVLDGRDIGTVICPEAQVKLFVVASDDARADRRFKELQARGETAIYAAVLQALRDRDRRDQERAAAPLKPAEDAVVLDTTELDAEAAFQRALAIVSARLSANPQA